MVICCILYFLTANSQPFTIKGNFAGRDRGAATLHYTYQQQPHTDSTRISKGLFSFNGTVTEPVRALLSIKLLPPAGSADTTGRELVLNQEFYLEPGTITVTGAGTGTAIVKGGSTQEDFNALSEQVKPQRSRMAQLLEKYYKAVREKNDTVLKQIMADAAIITEEEHAIEAAFIKTHPSSYLSWNLLKQRATIIDLPSFEPLFNGMDPKFRETEEGKDLVKRMYISKQTAVGNKAPDFTQNDVNSRSVTLASLKGKYVLLDFWASWCGPCRAENPNVLKAYNKFKDKNLEVLAVSLDNNKENWVKAIAHDAMPWIQVSDLKGWNNAVAIQYGIKSIPQNLLISPDGIILAKNLRGEALEKKLAEIIR